METKNLIVNIGSTSKKYAVYIGSKEIFKLNLESSNEYISKLIFGKEKIIKNISKFDFTNSIKYLKKQLLDFQIINSSKDISNIAIRVVCPGSYFLKNRKINLDYITKLNDFKDSAPLHIIPTLNEIKDLKKIFPETNIFGISDSKFHKTIPLVSRIYALPMDITKKFEIYRYGYHGISIKSIISKLDKLPAKIIVCHLGGGSSVTALKNGISIASSMGFTPLEGLLGNNRSGDLDPNILLYLSKKLKIKNSKLGEILNFG